MRIGFTGTSRGMTVIQANIVQNLFDLLDYIGKKKLGERNELHHGDCIGADERAQQEAKRLKWWVHSHPGFLLDSSKRAGTKADVEHPQKEPLERNRDIVAASEFMVACPFQTTEVLRSGTWATIRYARSGGVPGLIIWPGGELEKL